MILYHFTQLQYVKAIKRDGLLATPQEPGIGGGDFVGNGASVVYLCDTPTCANTDAEHEAVQRLCPEDPFVSRRWLAPYSNEPLARFTLRLPSSDRKLKQYGRWHHANRHRINLPDSDNIFVRRAMNTWWLYFGNIAPSKIIECIVEEAIPVGSRWHLRRVGADRVCDAHYAGDGGLLRRA